MRPISVLFALVCCAVAPAGATAATVEVPSGGSVQAALDGAAAGDTVRLGPGPHSGPIVVAVDLTLTGPESGEATLSAAGGTAVVEVLDSSATLSGFRVDAGGRDVGVLVDNPSLASRTVTVRDLRISGYAETGLVARSGGLALVAEGNAISGAGVGAPGPQRGITVEQGAVATVRDGTIGGNCGSLCGPGAEAPTDPSSAGVLARGSGASGVTVVGTVLADNLVGIRAAGAPRLDVLGARLTDNGTGVQVVDAEPGVAVAATQGVVHGSTISGGTRGVVVHDATPGDGLRPGPVLRADRIVGQSGPGALGVSANVPVQAADVWWGCNGGPGTAGCSTITTDVAATPHLVLRLGAGPGTIATGGGTASLTADVTRNAQGAATGAAFPDDTQVAFATDRGSVSPATAPTASGTAGATLTSGDAAGPATTSVTLDGQTVTALVTIAAPAPPTTVTQTTTVTAPSPPPTVEPTATPAPTPAPSATPTGAEMLAAARRAIGRKVVRLSPTLTPGVGYVDGSVRTGSGTITIDDENVVSLMVLACPERACDAGVSAKVERTSKAGRKLKPYALRRATFSLVAGRQRVVAVRLTGAQRQGIRRARTATMVVVAAVSGPGGDRSKKTLRLKLRIRPKAT